MIHQQIKEQIQKSMKNKEEIKLNVLRAILTALTNELVANKRKPSEILEDDKALRVIQRMTRQRKDSIEQFKKGGRADLVQKEKEELVFIEPFLPKMLSRKEIEKVALTKKAELKIEDKSKTGILMGAVMKELQGKVEGKDVKEIVEKLLN